MTKIELYTRMLELAEAEQDNELIFQLQEKLEKLKQKQKLNIQRAEAKRAPIISAIKEVLSEAGPYGGITAVSIQWSKPDKFTGISTHTIVNLLRLMEKNNEVVVERDPTKRRASHYRIQ